MATACKLEMSLDDIIKANKNRTNQPGPSARKTQMVGKRFTRGNVNKGRSFGRKPIGGQNPIKKKGATNRVGIIVNRGRPLRKVNRFGPGLRKNVALKNRAVISATKNLVDKLVKKALNKSNGSAINSFRGKRLAANRARRVRTIVLNKISPRSRVITRQRSRFIAVQPQQQPLVVHRVVRGPIRFASNNTIVPQASKTGPKRRLRVNSIQQQQPVVLVQQQSPQRVLPSFSSMSVRQHINALRRASTVQQLQTQFISQQQPIRQQFRGQQPVAPPFVFHRRQQKQPFIANQQSPIVVQQRPSFRRLRQPPAQYVIVQQPARGSRSQFYGKPIQSFRRQQQQQLDPLYEPPNFLQRIPTGNGASFIQY